MSSITYNGSTGQSVFAVPFIAGSASDLSVTVGGASAAFTFANGQITLGAALGSAQPVVINDIGRLATKNGSGTTEVSKSQQVVLDAVIPAGGTDTALVDLGNYRLVAVVIPAAFTGTGITPKTSFDGVTVNPMYDEAGNQKVLVCAPSRRIVVSPSDYLGARYLLLSSGSTEVAARTLKLVCEA